MLSFKDIPVTPFVDLLMARQGRSAHKGGPAWTDFESQLFARHCRDGVAVDHCPNACIPGTVLRGDHAWGGPIVGHYGHQLSEFSMRYVPTLVEWPQARFLVSSVQGQTTSENCPRFFLRILDWLGVSDVKFVQEPVLVRNLHVVAQAEQLRAVGPSPWHLSRMNTLTETRLGVPKGDSMQRRIYVSRSKQKSKIAGEAYVERLLHAVGFMVVYPEEHDLFDQLRMYRQAEKIVFCEGSALHTLQLLGEGLGEVLVLNRRKGATIAAEMIRPRCKNLHYIDALVGAVYPLTRQGMKALALGIGVPDIQKMVDELEVSGINVRSMVDVSHFRQAIASDLRHWVETWVKSVPRQVWNANFEHLSLLFDACGFGELTQHLAELTGKSGGKPLP